MAVLAVLPVLVAAWTPILPRLDFDVDPRMPGADLRVTLGAAGLAWLALWGTAAAWAGVAVSAAAGGRLRWRSTLLVLAGVAAAAWHFGTTFDDAYHGVGWVWAASAGLAAAHLGRHAEARRWLLALPVALLVPLLFQAGFYRWVSHPMTVEAYDAAVAAGTWAGPGSDDPGGAAARLYERRLRIDDATGPFGFANVLGTVAAGLAVAALAAVPKAWARGRAGAWIPVAGLLAAAAGLVVVALTRSAGAAAALAAGGFAFAAAWAWARFLPRRWGRIVLPVLAVGLVLGVVAVVIVRGMLGTPPPEVGVAGERTLLFRSQYWAGAAELWAGGAAVLGLGPGGFGAAYAGVKSELAPESVTSTHNVLFDFAVMLGLGGLAWGAVLLGWLASAARGVLASAERPEPEPELGPVDRPEAYAVGAVALLLFTLEAWVRLPELGPLDLAWRAVAAAGFVGVALAVRRASPAGAGFAMLGSAVAVLVHAQLDMGFFVPAAAPLLWLLVGLAAGAVEREPAAARERRRRAGPAAPAVAVVAGCVVLIVLFSGAARLRANAAGLAGAAGAARAGDARETLRLLGAASDAVGLDPVAASAEVRTLFEVAIAAGAAGRPAASAELYGRAAARAAETEQPSVEGEALARRAGLLEDPEAAAAARAASIAALRGAVDASPTRPERRIRLGEALLAAGDAEAAAAEWAEALRLDTKLYLDPDTQLRRASGRRSKNGSARSKPADRDRGEAGELPGSLGRPPGFGGVAARARTACCPSR